MNKTQRDQFVLDKIKGAFPDAVKEVQDFRGERTIIVAQETVHDICRLLREHEHLQYNFLADICADDLLPHYPRFAVSYHLRSLPNRHVFRLRTFVEDPDEGPQTVGDIWKVATWLEMEVWDLMGVRFQGNDSLRRLFLPEDWVGYPLRKDYPLGYEEVQFSFNWEAVQAKKPYGGRRNIYKLQSSSDAASDGDSGGAQRSK